MTRVAVLWQPDHYGEGTVKIMSEATEAAARALAVRLQRVEARSADDLAGAFGAMTEGRADALLVWTSAMFLSERKRIVDFAAKSRIPAVYPLCESRNERRHSHARSNSAGYPCKFIGRSGQGRRD